MLTVVISGSREYRRLYAVRDRVEALPEGTRVIVGRARGVDQHAERIANLCGHRVVPMPADWDAHGARAGHIRNDAMLELLKQHKKLGDDALVIAFHDGQSPGTASMISKAMKLGHPLEVYNAAAVKVTPHEQLRIFRANRDWHEAV